MWAGECVTFRGSKRAHEAAVEMAKPEMNEPDMSQSLPTSIGDTNIAKPEKVRSEPQTTATLSGVMLVFLHRPCSTTIGYCQKLSLMQLQRDRHT